MKSAAFPSICPGGIMPEELAQMRKEYYQLRGWDEQGVPGVDTRVQRARH